MKRSIKYHVMTRVAVIILTVLVSLSILSYMTIYRMLQTNISKKGVETSQSISQQINGTLEDVFRLSSQFSLNKDIQTFVRKTEYASPSEQVISVSRLMTEIKKNFVISKYIHSFCIVDAKGKYYWSLCPYDDFFKNRFESAVLKGKPLEEEIGFTSNYYFRADPNQSANLVSFVSNINEVKKGPLSTMGRVIINLNINELFRDIQNNKSFYQIGVIDEEDNIIHYSGEKEAEFLKKVRLISEERTVQKIGDYYVKMNIPLADWKLYLSFDENQINQTLDVPFLRMVIIVALCTMLLLFLLMFTLLPKISAQIVKLDQAMNQVAQGDLKASVSLRGSRELENISQRFNEMVVKIQQAMNKVKENEQAKQQASFELLLAKINPHFIYNTLNSVIYLARKNKDTEIIELTGAFIYLLQDSIHPGENTLFEKLDTEAEVIRKYVTIQKFRYAEQFRFLLDMEPELGEAYIPKNILQPIVENAIIHGNCSAETPVTIRLSLKKDGDTIQILIEDDGVGMEQRIADQLLSAPTSPETGPGTRKMRSIGIRNIAEKLNFVYQGRHTFRIFSCPGKGTRIQIVIPLYYQDNLPE